jgi:hypothetical protein
MVTAAGKIAIALSEAKSDDLPHHQWSFVRQTLAAKFLSPLHQNQANTDSLQGKHADIICET